MSSKLWLKKPVENVSQSDLRRAQEEKAARQTHPPPEPVRQPDPSAIRTPPPAGPVAAPDPTPLPERTPPPGEPVRKTGGYTPVTHHLLDDILPTLEPTEQVVLVRLYRLTWGHKKPICKVSKGTLITKTRVKKTKLLEALNVLADRGYIRRLPDDVSSRDVYDRGMNIEMLVEPVRTADPSVSRTRPSAGPIKDQRSKENISKGETDPAELERLKAEALSYGATLREEGKP